MERRDMLKSLALAAAAASAAQVATTGTAVAADVAGVVDITPVDKDYLIPERFTGKTMIVDGLRTRYGCGGSQAGSPGRRERGGR